jgi:hypothetical protein
MKSYQRPVLLTFASLCVALAACSGAGTRSSVTPSTSQAVAQAAAPSTLVRAASGATLDAGSGNAATIVAHGLSGDVRVSALRTAETVAAPPNPGWAMIPGTLDVAFKPATSVHASTAAALHLTLTYPADRAPAILEARMPLTVITYKDGRSGRFGFEGTFDTTHHTVRVDVPRALLNGAVNVKLGLAVDNPTYTLPPPGPRYWTGTSWSMTGKINPSLRTLVLIHGIFSSVETAFPNPCTPEIMKAGGYQQAVGWDYNWTNPPQVEGPKFAAFLNSLKAQNLNTFDVEAHSYGSPVTYAAVPQVTATMNNVVTLGGPLPLRGTPLARGALLRYVLVSLADVFIGPPSLINHAYSSGMVAASATDSTENQAILAAIVKMKNKPNFVDVAGTREYPEELLLYPLLYFYIDYPWDGIVEKVAANSVNIPNSFPNNFYEEHTELECAGSVISYVGSQVQPAKHSKLHL